MGGVGETKLWFVIEQRYVWVELRCLSFFFLHFFQKQTDQQKQHCRIQKHRPNPCQTHSFINALTNKTHNDELPDLRPLIWGQKANIPFCSFLGIKPICNSHLCFLLIIFICLHSFVQRPPVPPPQITHSTLGKCAKCIPSLGNCHTPENLPGISLGNL